MSLVGSCSARWINKPFLFPFVFFWNGSGDKSSISSTSPEAIYLNPLKLHIFHGWQKWWNINKNIGVIWWPNEWIIAYCWNRHLNILLPLLFCWNIFVLYCYEMMNISSKWALVHTGVNLGHFKAAHLDHYEIYMMKLTCWSPWTWDCLLEWNIVVTKITYIYR